MKPPVVLAVTAFALLGGTAVLFSRQGPVEADSEGLDSRAAAAPAESGAADVPAQLPGSLPPPAAADRSCRLQVRSADGWTDRGPVGCGADGSLRLLAVGDVGAVGAPIDKTVEAASAHCAEVGCDLLLIAGDLVYGPGVIAKEVWPRVWDRGLATLGLPGLTVLGNHEWRDYRTEPRPELKRAEVLGADGRAGLVIPAPTWSARVVRDGEAVFAFAGLDTDVYADPRNPDRPVGAEELAKACAENVPVVVVGHHPASSQGLHHAHEAAVERRVQDLLLESGPGCRIALVAAGHDHDLQAFPPGCEREGLPGILVSGVAGRGFRPPGPQHLPTCVDGERAPAYHAGPAATDGGFAHVTLSSDGGAVVRLFQAPGGPPRLLSEQTW